MTITGRFVSPQKITSGTITVQDGKITKFQKNFIKNPDYDFKNQYILPGLIEVHGHLREPGFSQKEDVPHGTRAALAGGFTTIIDMPNTNPPTATVKLLNDKIRKIYKNRSYVDYSFFMGVSKDSLGELEKVDKKKIVGVKLFMAGHETTPTTIPDDATLDKIFKVLSKRRILVAIHAEDQYLINKLNEKFKKTGRTDPALWSEIRPKEVVINAVKRVIKLASKYKNLKVYLLHLSTKEEFDLVSHAKISGMNIFGELVGYQLMFNISDYKKYGNKIKVAPALRTKEQQDTMWKMFGQNKIDVVCSEHTPHEWKTKKQPDMWKAQAGTPGLQETLPALITRFAEKFGKEKIEQCLILLSLYCSKNPAKIFGFENKGSLEVGKDADFVVLNMEDKWKVKKKDLFSKCGWSAYEGMNLIGRPQATFLKGELVYKTGKIIGKPCGERIVLN